jgi:DNA primase catalytic subunit
MAENEEIQFKKVREITQIYYSRKDIQQALFDFCQNRETVPRYGEGFGKRPDMLDYPSDILNYVKKGATSFHCSEEIWTNPLDIASVQNPAQLNTIKAGWDFLLDIDSKYFDYSKIAAEFLIKALEYHGVKNLGVKFSGSKGLHIIVPWKAFPKEFDGYETRLMFPEWPRIIAQYLHELIKDKLNEKIIEVTGKEALRDKGELIEETRCRKCQQQAETQKITKYKCQNCKADLASMKAVRKLLRCPSCQGNMDKIGEEEIFVCQHCRTNSKKNPELFEAQATTKSQKDSVDFVLVSPRHLFRAPYSLHEKTALASAVIKKEDLAKFQPSMADPMKVVPINYHPDSQEGEARELLAQALDWSKKKNPAERKTYSGSIDVKNLTIKEEMFPQCIKQILSGQKQDGRKRALFVLLAFFRSLELPRDYMESKVEDWNKKNYQPLKEGYIKSQIDWIMKNKIMPPNCKSHYYKDLGITCSCPVKNPVSFTIRQALRAKGRDEK